MKFIEIFNFFLAGFTFILLINIQIKFGELCKLLMKEVFTKEFWLAKPTIFYKEEHFLNQI
jgi:hypothetical protein